MQSMLNVRKRPISGLALAATALVSVACGAAGDPPCLELAKGNRFEIAIESIDESECASGFLGLAPGNRLVATVRGFVPSAGLDECSPAWVELEALDDPDGRWTPADPTNVDHYGGIYIFRRGDCRSNVLLTGRGAPVGTLRIASDPETVEGAPACAESCMATANVRLTPL